MLTISELRSGHRAAPEYLVNIFIIQRDYGYANNARLADWMKVSRSAVSQAVGRLKALSLVKQDAYGGIRLSSDGKGIAENVLRRHYLIEHLLVRVLEYPWDKADEEASRIQETISDEFTEYLFEHLGMPATCPHGNPFPGSDVEESLIGARKLTDATVGDSVRIMRITEEGENVSGMLTLCYQHRISPGSVFCILDVNDEGLELVRLPKKTQFRLPLMYARHVRIERVS
jgi:DtxR family transcriptional regulator, Mn-dependent transcriptional regulator